MSDIKLFRLQAGQATELQGEASDLEKPLQTLIENNLGPLLRIRFLATEYATGRTHAGRIDTLGLDENHCPVILEYKRSLGENVINQGLYERELAPRHVARQTPSARPCQTDRGPDRKTGAHGLPPPHVLHPWPEERFGVKHPR